MSPREAKPGHGPSKKELEATRRAKEDKVRIATYRAIAFEGRDGLIELTSRFPQKESLFPGSAAFEALPFETKKKAKEDQTRMLLGPVHKGIDIAITEGRFDPREFYGWYRSLAKDTRAPNNPGILPTDKPATPEEIRKVRDYAKRNPSTRAGFFSWQGLRVLPYWLRRIILNGQTYQIFRDVVIPQYNKRLAEQAVGRSHRAITERKVLKRKEEGRPLEQGDQDADLVKYTVARDKKRKPEEREQTYRVFRFQEKFEEMMITHHKMDRKGYQQWKQNKREATRNVLGEDYKEKAPTVTVSTATVCVRKAQYLELGEEYGYELDEDATFKKAMGLLSGSALHKMYQYAGNRLEETEIKTEIKLPFLLEPTDTVKGKPDAIWRNPKTGEWQVIEYKNLGSYLFNQITRDALPDHMKNTPGIYAPLADHRLQTLVYIWLLRKKGYDVKVGNIMYVHKDPRGRTMAVKEAIVIWDAVAELEVTNFLKQLEDANSQLAEIQKLKNEGGFHISIAENILHDRTTDDPWVCENCEAKKYCIRKIITPGMAEKKPALPPAVLEEVVAQHQELEEKLRDDGRLGTTLLPAADIEGTKRPVVDRTKSRYAPQSSQPA